ncbi:MAG TPA: serine/threonine-protein kinase [Actinocrinis sp.]|nr:serine/threonine-protein kinase [Actinocrinis sp.]HEV3170519.1 serine/threonine-protein kinase [Actinocrinis sp.]
MSAWGIDRRLIDDRFELLEQLGGGGMGMVWRARDTVLHREVALKEVRHSGAGSDPAAERLMRERVLREARALARLHHPNVVTIHHIVDRPDLPYPWLVMELVPGGSLASRLDLGPLAPTEAARIGRGVLAALRAAHDAGIQHRDVKPANVLLRPDGSPVLTDFGIAALQEATGLTATGSLIGSPEYIAPERLRGEEGNPASDFWSLGMMLYVAVEGYNPLRRPTSIATLAAVLDQPIPEPAHAGPLTGVLAAVLKRDPADRPDPDTLDRMLAAAEAGWAAPYVPGPRSASGSGSVPGSSLGATGNQPYATSGPQPHAQWSPADSGTGPGRPRPLLRRRFTGVIIGTAAAGVIGALAWSLYAVGSPKTQGPPVGGSARSSGGTQTGPSITPDAAAATGASAGAAADATGAPDTSGADQSLFTAAGMRGLVATLRSTLGSTVVAEVDVYSDHATIEAPNRKDSRVYDNYDYSGGVLSAPTPGGTMDTTDGTVDLNTVNWNVLPTLFAEVDAKVGTPNANDHYFIVDPNWFDYGPTLRVYSSNDYGGGYMATDFKGHIIRVYPFS